MYRPEYLILSRPWSCQWKNFYFCPCHFLISIFSFWYNNNHFNTWTYHSQSRLIMHSRCVSRGHNSQLRLIAHFCCHGSPFSVVNNLRCPFSFFIFIQDWSFAKVIMQLRRLRRTLNKDHRLLKRTRNFTLEWYNYSILTTFGTQTLLKRKYQSYIMFNLHLLPLLLNY